MAINSALKRRAVSGIPMCYGITPNSAKNALWRDTVAWSYPLGAGVSIPVILKIIITKQYDSHVITTPQYGHS